MSSCKKVCMIENCQNTPNFYVNVSRYHKVCEAHVNNFSQNDIEIDCFNCKNSILCLKDLPLKEVATYKASLKANRVKVTPSEPTPSNTCSDANCGLDAVVHPCEAHSYCNNHRKTTEAGEFCKLCKCTICQTALGVTVKDCGIKCCEKCKVKTRCCIVCCKFTSSSPQVGCGHFLCDSHNDPKLMCHCKSCEICCTERSKKRNCGHRLCGKCEVNDTCTLCFNSACDHCKRFESVYGFACNLHKYCKDCYYLYNNCINCNPLCVRCTQQHITLNPESVSCKIHPLCYECSKYFDTSFCVYCKNPKDFTCENCNQTHYYFAQSLNCQHIICIYCSNLSCSHKECPKCTSVREFCVLCYPQYFCKQCKTLDSSKPICCSHGLCRNCGIANSDEDYVCLKCHKADTWNGICLFCNPPESTCSLCAAKSNLHPSSPYLSCSKHPLCQKCFESYSSQRPSCIICEPCSICRDPRCIPEVLPCSHQVCSLFLGDDCRQCSNSIKCIFCSQETKNPGSIFCTACRDSESLESLRYAECSICKKMIFGLDVKTGKSFKCVSCIKFKRFDRFCNICEERYSSGLGCHHGVCFKCSSKNKCTSCHCLSCNKMIRSFNCNHGYCIKCYKLHCKSCQKNQGCKICQRTKCRSLKNTIETCDFLESYQITFKHQLKGTCENCKTQDVLCKHRFCYSCRQQQCSCVCEICQKKRKFDVCVCGHQVCYSDSFYSNCQKCFESECSLCQKPKTLKFKDSQGQLKCRFHLDSSN